MRILINGLMIFRNGGHYSFFKNIIPGLGTWGSDHEFILLHSSWQEALNFKLPLNFRRYLHGPPRLSPFLRIIWEQMYLPWIIHKEQIDVLFAPEASTGAYFPCPVVMSVRNPNPFEPISNTDIRYFIRNTLLRLITKTTTKHAKYVFFVSNYSLKTAQNYLKLDSNKTKVIYHSVNPQFFLPADMPFDKSTLIPQPYILTVSTIQTHKNYPKLLDAFERLCNDPSFIHHLVIAGPIGSKNEFSKIKSMMDTQLLRGRVHYIGEVPFNELPRLYQSASVYVLPSLLETFGYTLVEAMASGVPVVTSNTSAMPEIAAEAALYFDPNDVDDICYKIHEVLSNDALSVKLVEAGYRRAKDFSIDKTVKQLINLFELAHIPS